jgi:hypothetical protein
MSGLVSLGWRVNMKVTSYICDICGKPFPESDLNRAILGGHSADLDSVCMETLTALTKDTPKWDAERESYVAAKEAKRVAREALRLAEAEVESAAAAETPKEA